jgi:DNA-binding response OmpR family regulator
MSGLARSSMDSASGHFDSPDLLTKPFTAEELLSRIAQTLEARRRAR